LAGWRRSPQKEKKARKKPGVPLSTNCVCERSREDGKRQKKKLKKIKKRSEEAKSQSQSKPSKRVWAIQAKPYPVIQVHQQQGFIFPFLIN
jgi:hypothetical protein